MHNEFMHTIISYIVFFKGNYENSLNSDCQQCLQYQQNETTTTSNYLNTKMITTYDIRNSYPGLGKAHTFGEVTLVKGIPFIS